MNQEKIIFPKRKKITRQSFKKKSIENSPPIERIIPLKRQGVFLSPRTPLSPKNQNLKNDNIVNEILSPTKRCLSFTQNSPVLKIVKNQSLAYSKTKQVLQTSIPQNLLCRDSESKFITDFIITKLSQRISGSLYISGPPGTGKTAVLTKAIEKLCLMEKELKTIFINCMSMSNSQAIFACIAECLNLHPASSRDSAIILIQQHLQSDRDSILLVLDEIDSLDNRNQEILYTIFDWPSHYRIIIIGIANSLDLTDRILPRLQGSKESKPKLLNFKPYSKEQIAIILNDRLAEVSEDAVLEASAVQFCARKVSAVSGDLRKALDVCRRAVEIVEIDDSKQTKIAENGKTKTVGMAVVLKILNEIQGGNEIIRRSTDKKLDLPLHQALALSTLLIIIRISQAKVKETTLGKFHECFSKVCKKHGVNQVDQSEFISMCEHIETHSLITIKRTKEIRSWKISLRINESELENIMQDKSMISSVIQAGI